MLTGPSLLSLLVGLAIYAPQLIAILYGVSLCVRHARSKPRTVKRTKIAIAWMVAGYLPGFLVTLASMAGFVMFTMGITVQMLVIFMRSVLPAIGLGLLFREAFWDEVEVPADVDIDDGPPVFRYDDGTVADD